MNGGMKKPRCADAVLKVLLSSKRSVSVARLQIRSGFRADRVRAAVRWLWLQGRLKITDRPRNTDRKVIAVRK